MRRTALALLGLALSPGLAAAQTELLHAGPMHAWTALRATAIWVQTAREAAVQLRYQPVDHPEAARLTPAALTSADRDLIAVFTLDGLEPATTYRYELYINGSLIERPYPLTFTTQPLWQWRTPPPPEFEAMLGSCAYINETPYDRPGKPYGGDYEIFGAMAARRPDLMLWLGDNLYYREADFTSPSGMAARYWHDRALPELQPFLASTSNYAIWDDHDFGPNDSDESFPLKGATAVLFARYWPALAAGLPGVPGVFQKVTWGDVDFFLLDDRSFRKPNRWPVGPDKTMLGRAQLDWLKESLVYSRAAFKVIALGNQVLNPACEYEVLAHYPTDYREILDWIKTQRLDGVLFISGDRHHSELIRLNLPGVYPLYDFTSSPFTAGVHTMAADDPEISNPNRVPGTLVMAHSFGVLRFSGSRSQRQVTLRAYDTAGGLLWERTITRAEISFPEPPEKGKRHAEPSP